MEEGKDGGGVHLTDSDGSSTNPEGGGSLTVVFPSGGKFPHLEVQD